MDFGQRFPKDFGIEGISIAGLFQDSQDNIWIGTSGRGLIKYDPKDDNFDQFLPHEDGSNSISSLYPYYFVEDDQGRLWIGINEGGLDYFDSKTGRFVHFDHNPFDSVSLSSSTVKVVFQDSRNSIWIGTERGLDLYQEDLESFRHFDEDNGFISAGVSSIEEDGIGNLWIGTSRGMYHYEFKTEKFHRYDEADGLTEHNFLWSQSVRHPASGQLIFGTMGGLLIFDPLSFDRNQFVPPVVIAKSTFYFSSKNASYKEHLWPGNRRHFDLPYTVNILEFDIAALNYEQAHKNQYAYKLEPQSSFFGGSDDIARIDLGHQNKLRFANLSSGDYRLSVFGSNNDGIWNNLGTTLMLTIQPPWWRTSWAYAFYLLCATSIIMLWRHLELNRRQLRQEAALERARAEEKQAQSKQIEAQAERLEKSLSELRRKNEEIIIAQNQLVQQEKLASLGQLTAGIAHEIKNPLNFVNNFAEGSIELLNELTQEIKLLTKAPNPDLVDRIILLVDELAQNSADIRDNGGRADRIIHSMMDHARGTSGELRYVDVNQLVDDTVNLAYHGYRALDPRFSAHIQRDYDPKVSLVEVFPQELGRALLNLLNNACYAVNQKHRKLGSDFRPVVKITTRKLQVESADEKGLIEIHIRDNGFGIAEDVKERIFQPFYTTKPPGSGNTGLGLSISYDIIVNQHGGKLSLETKDNEFTDFAIILPVDHTE